VLKSTKNGINDAFATEESTVSVRRRIIASYENKMYNGKSISRLVFVHFFVFVAILSQYFGVA